MSFGARRCINYFMNQHKGSTRFMSTRSSLHKDRQKTNFYSILRISPNASASQIKTAYYKLSLIYHPDKNSGSTESQDKFAAISEAYQVLSDKEKRLQYDRTLARPSSPSPSQVQFSEDILKRYNKKNLKYRYDYDEWTRAHYGTAFKDSQRRSRDKIEALRRMKEARDNDLTRRRILQVSIFLMTAFCAYTLSV